MVIIAQMKTDLLRGTRFLKVHHERLSVGACDSAEFVAVCSDTDQGAACRIGKSSRHNGLRH